MGVFLVFSFSFHISFRQSQFPFFSFSSAVLGVSGFFKRLPPLHRLNGNIIGNEGAAAIGEALKRNKSLTWLQ
jgi:hypothetical protein